MKEVTFQARIVGWVIAIAIAGAFLSAASAQDANVSARSDTKTIEESAAQLRGTADLVDPRVRAFGGWKPQRQAAKSTQDWDIDVYRTVDGELQGRVRLGDSGLASSGHLSARVNGDRVMGTIKDEQGGLIATIVGAISDKGIKGTYFDRTGERGEWQWLGSLR